MGPVGEVRGGYRGNHDSIVVESRVQAAVGVVANRPKIIAVRTGHDDLPIALDRHGGGDVVLVSTSHRGGHDAVRVKTRIGTTVGVVTDHGNVLKRVGGDVCIRPGNDDFAVALNRHTPGVVVLWTNGRGHDAANAETGIQAAVGIVPGHSEIDIRSRVTVEAHHHNFAIRLNRHVPSFAGCTKQTDLRSHKSAGTKVFVQRAIGIVPGQGEAIRIGRPSRDDNLTVILKRHALTASSIWIEVGGHFSAGPKTGVQVTRGTIDVYGRRRVDDGQVGGGRPDVGPVAGLDGHVARAVGTVVDSQGHQFSPGERGRLAGDVFVVVAIAVHVPAVGERRGIGICGGGRVQVQRIAFADRVRSTRVGHRGAVVVDNRAHCRDWATLVYPYGAAERIAREHSVQIAVAVKIP